MVEMLVIRAFLFRRGGKKVKKAVIIGAGQTGRGFVAPILNENNYSITFLDENTSLIYKLQNEKKYIIHYFGNTKPSEEINDFEALSINDEEALQRLIDSDVVITSVFSGHLVELIPYLKKAGNKRQKPLVIICCENGVNVKKPLTDAHLNAIITEGIIFCTTLKPHKDSLDLMSEAIDAIPIDGSVPNLELEINRMPQENNFAQLIQRKIYTYNFMSALIAYLGWYKHYEVYAEAAADEEISSIIESVKPIVSSVIAKEYAISYEEQLAFTQRAIDKFKNKEIFDTIYRNARQSKRKLGENERLLSPLKFAQKYESDTKYFDLIIAAAILYAVKEESENIDLLWEELNVGDDIDLIKKAYVSFENGGSISDTLKKLQ